MRVIDEGVMLGWPLPLGATRGRVHVTVIDPSADCTYLYDTLVN
jgi:hypothetical protein